jgi:hypothetical protein
MLLGFILAVLSIVKSTKTTTFLVLVVPALLLALPMMDTAWAFVRRGIMGRNPFKPDRGHLHHRLLDLKFTQKQVLGLFFSLSTGMGFLALLLVQTEQANVLVLAVCLLLLTLATVKAMQVYNLNSVVQRMNRKMREMARKAVQREPTGTERVVTNFMVLCGLCGLNLFIAAGQGRGSLVFTLAALGLFGLGLADVFLNLREEGRYEITHVVLFLSLVLNQIALLALWHRHYLVTPDFAVSALLVLVLLAMFIYRTGTFAVFLQDPMEILALYLGVVVCGLAKHFLGAPAVLPFAVALANALVLYILLKIYLAGYRMRSWARSLGFVGCVAILIAVPWFV